MRDASRSARRQNPLSMAAECIRSRVRNYCPDVVSSFSWEMFAHDWRYLGSRSSLLGLGDNLATTVFKEQLAPLRERMVSARATIRPVSRISFELTDKSAFEKSVSLCLKWMEASARVDLPEVAWDGKPFDVTDILGANPAKAARIDASDGSIWAARLDFPDPEHPRVWVSEFFAERRKGSVGRFGAQLTCVVRGEAPPFEVTRPTVVRHVLETLSAEADGWPLSDKATTLGTGDLASLEALLYDPHRRLPVLAISENESGATQLNPDALARQIAGSAHIVVLPSEVSWGLTHAVGKMMSVFGGAVRLYLPGLSDDLEDPFQHPLWLPNAHAPQERLGGEIASRVLPLAFLAGTQSTEFPRYALLRDLSARHVLDQRQSTRGSENAKNELAVLQARFVEVEEERDTWESLAHEEVAKRLALEAEAERLRTEAARLTAKASALERSLGSPAKETTDSVPQRRLSSYLDLEDWAGEVLGPNVYVHPAALKDCRKNGHENMLDRIEAALLVIRDFVVPARKDGGIERRDLAKKKLLELGMDDTACFVERDEAKRSPPYKVQYNGTSVVLFDHIKYGNGYDNANQIRIYYTWDAKNEVFVIGKMPSHLKNNMTN